MKARMMFVVGSLATLASSSAFAEESSTSLTAEAPKMRLAAQVEVLPSGSADEKVGGVSANADMAVAYGISAGFDYAVHKYFSIGVAPRLLLNVKPDGDDGDDVDANKAIDLRARLVGHYPVAPKLEVYAALTPGYSIVLSNNDAASNATGFAIGGAVGATYDVSPSVFLTGEVGYQRAFTSTDVTFLGQKMSEDLDLSYLHIGLGAGTRF